MRILFPYDDDKQNQSNSFVSNYVPQSLILVLVTNLVLFLHFVLFAVRTASIALLSWSLIPLPSILREVMVLFFFKCIRQCLATFDTDFIVLEVNRSDGVVTFKRISQSLGTFVTDVIKALEVNNSDGVIFFK